MDVKRGHDGNVRSDSMQGPLPNGAWRVDHPGALLTDTKGLAGPSGLPIWPGIREPQGAASSYGRNAGAEAAGPARSSIRI